MVKVKIRQERKPMIGDKFASRYSMKGVISVILDDEYMPRVRSGPNKGIIPDIICNPHAIASRMTANELKEMKVSKAALLIGERVNCTAFNELNEDYYSKILSDNGLDPDGYEEMEVPIFKAQTIGIGPSGLVPTGRYRPYKRKVFMGPCYYQSLRHHVLDKYQMRGHGAIKPISHQPVGGRSNEGGQRVGEMERDAFISHAATAIIRERLKDVSDAYKAVVHTKCGRLAIANNLDRIYECRCCDVKVDLKKNTNSRECGFGIVNIPYVFKYMIYLLLAAYMDLRFEVSLIDTGDATLEERYTS